MADENDPDRPDEGPPPAPPESGEPSPPDNAEDLSAAASEQPPSAGDSESEEGFVLAREADEAASEEAREGDADEVEDFVLARESEEAPSPPDELPEQQDAINSPGAPPLLRAEGEQAAPEIEDAFAASTNDAEEAAPEATSFVRVDDEQTPSEIEGVVAPTANDIDEAAPETPPLARAEDEQVSQQVEAAAAPPTHEADEAAPEQVAAAAQEAGEDLPPNYFRAAGDPDEPPEAGPSLLHRMRDRVTTTARDAWTVIEPSWVAFAGAARGFAIALWRRIVGIQPPRTIKETAVWGGWAAAGLFAVVIGFFTYVTWGMPSADDVWEARQGQSITFVDRNNNVILREGAQNAPPVDLNTLPPYVAQAFIAIEDRRFYDHMGVDLGGIMRAGAENLRAGRVVQGGSTITQQLAKNLFLTNERSWRRKAQEIALAFWLEGRFTKEQILALYLSRVYFGAGAYGIEAAAERYFDRPARELTLLQSAMLAGLVKAPSRLNPARQDIAAARARAEVVLNEMVSLGFISAAERDAALQEELVISRRNPAGVLSYYRDWIDPLLNEVIGQQRDDFVVETTIDIAAQRAAAEAVEAVLAEQGEQRRVEQAAALVLDDEGAVRVMVGGRDYDVSQFNRATQARRQPGSAFKFFIYLAAMENGLTPWTIRDDAPITIYIEGQPPWSPGNYTGEYHGPVTLTSAFAHSFNMVAIRVSHEVGGDKVIDVARKLGVTSPLHNYHSLALGAQEITLLEMAQAYGAMASEGYNVEAHGVLRIRRANSDETMWSWRPSRRERVIEERPLRYMNHMMQRVVEAGTGTRARITGRQIGGKTGTGNDYRDAWFIGFTPGMVGGVWVGNDNFSETARVTGGSLPAEIWARFMPTALRSTPPRELLLPRPEDYDLGLPQAPVPELTVVGAPIGVGVGPPLPPPPDDQDRSLDFGPEG